MTDLQFWTPWFLAGLIFLAVPFLLLLTKAQSTRTISFSSIQFLRTVIEKASNSIEWKRLLLLACRLLALACLSAAFALPFLAYSRAGVPASAHRHMIYVLDDSYSMSYTESGISLFDRARQYIRENARKHQNQRTRFSLYLYDHKLVPLILKAAKASQLIAKLDQTAVSDGKSDFSSLASALDAQIAPEDGMRTQVAIVSDFSVSEQGTAKQIKSLPDGPSQRYQVEMVSVQPEHYRNLVVEDLNLPPRPFVPGEEEALQASFRAYGIPAGTKVRFNFWIENNLTGTREVEIPESGVGTVDFRCRFPAQGNFPVRVEAAAADGLLTDNVRYAVASVRSPVKILIIDNERFQYPFENPSYYFENALLSYDTSLTESSEKPSERWLDTAHLQVSDLAPVAFDSYDLIVMAGVSGVNSEDLGRLHAYIRNGGTIFFAPGKSFALADYRGPHWMTLLGGTFSEPETQAEGGIPLNFNAIAWQHPALQIFDSGRQGDLGKISVRKYAPFIPVDEARNPEALLRIHSRPAFLEMHDGPGKIFLWTTTLNTDWNDFPKHPLYVPFIFEILKYGVFKGWQNPGGIKVGQEIRFKDIGREKPFQIRITDPAGEQTMLYSTPQNPISEWATLRTGIYEWISDGAVTPVRHFMAVNPDTNESVPAYLSLKKRDAVHASRAQMVDFKIFSPEKRFFYMPLFYAIFALLFVESWLANRFYKPGWIQ